MLEIFDTTVKKEETAEDYQKASDSISAFDLDYTIITTKSGKKFPVDKNDWKLMPGIKTRLLEINKTHKIVVITNQGYKNFNIEEFKYKLNAISTELGISLQVFACTDDDIDSNNRKPRTGMWTAVQNNNNGISVDLSKSSFTGDAAGRPGDFSDCDLKFALNVGITFYTEDGIIWSKDAPKHPLFGIEKVSLSTTYDIKHSDKELILLVGSPGSSKSNVAKWLNINLKYVIICQDSLGTKQKVISEYRKALMSGESIVIDRKNEYITDRKMFIDLAKSFGYTVKILYMDTSREIVEHLSTYRYITEGKHIPRIVYNKYYSEKCGLEYPTEDEAPVEILKFKINDNIITDKKLFYSYLN